MFGKGLHNLLIAAILGWPFVCNQGLCDCTKQSDTPACCDDCDSRCPQPTTPVEAPNGPCDGPCEDCQCICGGAIFEDFSQHERLLQFAAELDSFLCGNVSADSFHVNRLLAPDPVPDDGRVASGRMICCRHMTFLC